MLGKYIEKEMLRQAARDIIASKPAWKQLITLTGPVAKWAYVAAGLMGLGAWASWPVADNLSTMLSIDGRTMLSLVKDGKMSKEEALEKLAGMEALFIQGQDFVDTQTTFNPVVRFLTPTFKLATDAAFLLFTQTKAEIEAFIPPTTPPPPVPPVPPPGEEPPETPPGDETPDPVNVPTEGKSFITLVSNPEGANIWIDGENTFTQTPFAHLLDSGTHNIQLSLFKHTPTFETVTLEPGKSIIKTYTLEALSPTEPESPFIPVPIEVPLERPEPVVIKPNAWEYTITARDGSTQQILNAKIIVDGIFTGKYTTNSIILEPDASYLLRLEAFGYEPGEVTINTEALPD